jgi:hypothetical protein
MIENIMVYAIEALCLGIFMVVATLKTAAIELPTSPIYQAIADLSPSFSTLFDMQKTLMQANG